MTRNRKLRDELHDLPPDLDLGASSAQLMRRGRRIRSIRQGAVVGAVALVVVGIGTGAAQLGQHGSAVVSSAAGGLSASLPAGAVAATSSPNPAAVPSAVPSPIDSVTATPGPAASASPGEPTPIASVPGMTFGSKPPASSVPVASVATATATPSAASVTCSPAPQSTVGAPPATDGPTATPWGSPVTVGRDSAGPSVVIYGFHIADAQIPCTSVGFMLGTQSSSGGVSAVTAEVAANETVVSDLAPGFHATSSSGGNEQLSDWYVFGYYVGPAASIAIPEKQSSLPATPTHLAAWSVNPDVKIWWISGTGSVPSTGAPVAYSATGTLLPAGNDSAPGVG